MSALPPGGVDLAQPRGLPIKDARLLHLAQLSLQPGGLDQGEAIAHLRVIDVPNLTAYLVPLNAKALQVILDSASEIIQNAGSGRPDTPPENRGERTAP